MLIGTRRALLGGAGFLPTQIAGIQLWLAADRGLSLADGDPVTTWPDQSGNGNDLVQATASKKPVLKINIVNGKPVVRFDGTDDWLKTAAFTLNQPTTIFLVADVESVANASRIFDGNAINQIGLIYIDSTTELKMYAGSYGPKQTRPSGFHIFICEYNGASSNFWIDGGTAATGDVSTNNAGGFIIGSAADANSASAEDIAEVAIYNLSLYSSDLSRLNNYAHSRYGITLA